MRPIWRLRSMEIKVGESILSKNDQIALETEKLFQDMKVFCINMMSSPGSGKTTILEKTIPLLTEHINIGVLEGDVATDIDADRIKKFDIPVVQVTTDKFGGSCHLSARMVADRLSEFPLKNLDLLIIENVGNLICPAGFRIGSDRDVVVVSLTEGPEKPLKYPAIFQRSHLVLINKLDIAVPLNVRPEQISDNVKRINPNVEIFNLSGLTGQGIEPWINWILTNTSKKTGRQLESVKSF